MFQGDGIIGDFHLLYFSVQTMYYFYNKILEKQHVLYLSKAVLFGAWTDRFLFKDKNLGKVIMGRRWKRGKIWSVG